VGTSSGVYFARVGEFNFKKIEVEKISTSYIIDLLISGDKLLIQTKEKLYILVTKFHKGSN
jgi:hypothetical protein